MLCKNVHVCFRVACSLHGSHAQVQQVTAGRLRQELACHGRSEARASSPRAAGGEQRAQRPARESLGSNAELEQLLETNTRGKERGKTKGWTGKCGIKHQKMSWNNTMCVSAECPLLRPLLLLQVPMGTPSPHAAVGLITQSGLLM